MSTMYKEAKPKMPSQKVKIVQMLKEAGSEGVLNTALNKVSFRYSDRLYQLKKEGYEFGLENLGDGVCRYFLIKTPEVAPQAVKKGIDVLKDAINAQYFGAITPNELEKLMNKLDLNAIRKPNTLKVK